MRSYMIIFLPPTLHKHFRFPQHVDDLLCCESFSWHGCLSCGYSNGYSLTFKVDQFLGRRSEKILREQRELALGNHQLLARYALRDETALEPLKDRAVVVTEGINMEDGLDADELFLIEEQILNRLGKIATLRSDIEQELELYRVKQRELAR